MPRPGLKEAEPDHSNWDNRHQVCAREVFPRKNAVTKGVQFTSKGESTQSIAVRKEAIIAAGAINSPRLLELSGVGGADLLQRVGLDVVVDNPYVRENLQNHLFTGLTFEARDEVDLIDALFRQEPESVAAAIQDYGTRGLVSSAPAT